MMLICIDFFKLSLSEQIARLMLITNELSLPFCQLVVHYLNNEDGQDNPPNNEDSPNLSNAAFDTIKLSIERGCDVWSELFEVLMGDLAPRVRLRL